MLPATRPTLKKAFNSNALRSYSIFNGKSKTGSSTQEEPLIKNAPDWDEKDATESEADVKADRDDDDLSSIEKKSTKWFQNEKAR